MKYYIIPAQSLQSGDVIFNGGPNGVAFCGRVIRESLEPPENGVVEWRVEVMDATKLETPVETGKHTTVQFPQDVLLGVVREDEYVDTDIASILANL